VNASWGAKTLVGNMEKSLAELGGKVVAGGPAVKAGAPLSMWKGPDAKPDDVAACEAFGKKVARQLADKDALRFPNLGATCRL